MNTTMNYLNTATWLGRIGLGCIVLTFWWPVAAFFGMLFGVIGVTIAGGVIFAHKKNKSTTIQQASRAVLLGGAAVLLGVLALTM